ncbi:hypothetical protein [Hyphomicrobium sp.]|uniref:hypothetical protein n=1 Tax=Hyphomicrobium sp. TaxID=82 RepID=UPI002E36B86F|nr:hypothetical protein [Hyphomicrobium sp.]HEX2840570.1 hypothetical protein [Hyphomicrobium sp.]
MTLKKFTTSAAVIAGLLAANLGPLTTAANARDGWRRDYDRGYDRHYDGPRHYHGPRHRYGYKRDRHGKDIAKGVAIGLGILAVGTILSSAHR